MKRGAAWELALEVYHDGYRRDRLAVIWKTHPPVRMLSDKDRRGQFQATFDGNGPPDYIGFAGDNGVVFDAKEVAKGLRLPLSRIEPHQARDLEAASLQGCIAFIACRFREKKRDVVFLWKEISGLYWDGQPSVHADDGIPMLPSGWLEVV